MTSWLNHGGAKPLAALAAIAALCLNLAAAVGVSRPASAQAQNRAGLVIAYANGAVETRCVAFSEPSITGYELMRRSGLPFSAQVSGLGAAMCKIGDEGCAYPAQSCFCKCENPASGCGYWIYGQWSGAAWRYAGVGAVARTVTDGQVDGWVWDVVSGAAAAVRLPPVTLDQICAPRSASTASPTRAAASALTPTQAGATKPPATGLPTRQPPSTAVPVPSATFAPTTAPATPTSASPPTVTAFAPTLARPAPSAAPIATEPPEVAATSTNPIRASTPIANPVAASGEGIAGFLGIMAVLAGGALVLQRFGLRRGRR